MKVIKKTLTKCHKTKVTVNQTAAKQKLHTQPFNTNLSCLEQTTAAGPGLRERPGKPHLHEVNVGFRDMAWRV